VIRPPPEHDVAPSFTVSGHALGRAVGCGLGGALRLALRRRRAPRCAAGPWQVRGRSVAGPPQIRGRLVAGQARRHRAYTSAPTARCLVGWTHGDDAVGSPASLACMACAARCSPNSLSCAGNESRAAERGADDQSSSQPPQLRDPADLPFFRVHTNRDAVLVAFISPR
jgi:hypothetical protein